MQAREDGTGDALLPAVVDDRDCTAEAHGCADGFKAGTQHGEHPHRAGLSSQADGALQKEFALKLEQLLGPTQSSAAAGGQNEGIDRHGPSVTVILEPWIRWGQDKPTVGATFLPGGPSLQSVYAYRSRDNSGAAQRAGQRTHATL